MNWVGGARKRVKLQGEKKLQKEFFERKKLENRPFKKRNSNIQKPSTVSQDLLALQTVSNIQYLTKDVPKSVRKLDLDQFKSIVSGRRYNDVELPSSPNEKPSMIHLFEKGYSSLDDMSTSLKRCKYGPEPEVSKSFKTNVPQMNNMPRHVSYENTDSCKQQRAPVCLNPFDKSFQAVPLSQSSRKSCLKPSKSMSYEDHDTRSFPRKTHTQVIPNSRKSTYIAFDPWASEDFQATPLVKYETEKSQGSGFNRKKGDFISLQDRGYITDQERFHKQTHTKFHDRKPSQSLDIEGWKKTQPFEVSFDHDDSKTDGKRLSHSFNDIYDDHIENRFRSSAPMFSKMNRERVPVSQKSGTSFADLPRGRTITSDHQRSRHVVTENQRSRMTLPECERSCSVSQQETLSVTYLDRGMSKMNFTPSNQSDRQISELFSNKHQSRDRFFVEDSHLKNETVSLKSGTTSLPSNFGNNIPRRSPDIASPFPQVKISGPGKLKHRESSSMIKSVSSTTSSCSETQSCINHDRLSDFESELQDSVKHLEDSTDLKNIEEEQMKKSSIDEILNEMKQLENESVNDFLSEQNQDRFETVITDDEKNKELSLLMEEAEPVTDEEFEEVNEVLQEIVHKVVLSTFHHAAESAAFVIPSRSITATPWKSATKLLKFSQDSCKSSQDTYQSSQNSCINSQDVVKSSQDITSRDANQSFDGALIGSRVSQNMDVKSSTMPDSLDVCSAKQKKSSEAVKDCAFTPSWNNLNLVSPSTSVSLHQGYKGSTSMNQSARELFPEEVLTPMMKTKSLAIDPLNQFDTPCTGKPINKVLQQQEMQNGSRVESKGRISLNSDMIHVSTPQNKKISHHEQENKPGEIKRSNFASSFITTGFCCNDKATQTKRTRNDVSTSPIQFESFKTTVDAGTQYSVPSTDWYVTEALQNTDRSVVEVAMEQGESQELMDCSVQVEVMPIDNQWTISDSMLEPSSQSDSVGYSLRSRTKST